MTKNLEELFLIDTSDTGRFIVKSKRTGKTYYVEPIGDPHIEWGSVDPGTGNLMVKKGWKKNKGSINESESLITIDTGFKEDKIHMLKPGVSPYAYINMLDEQYPDMIVETPE